MHVTPEQWASEHPELPASAYPRGVARVIVAKHRNGPIGDVDLRFRERLARFEDWALHPDDADSDRVQQAEISRELAGQEL